MFKHREEYRRLRDTLEERLKRGMYGEEYHRIEMAMMEIELANAPLTGRKNSATNTAGPPAISTT
jgi:hypothetical protein